MNCLGVGVGISDLTWWGWGGEVDSQIHTTAQILHVIPGEKS